MTYLPWQEEYSVGLKEFDDQHKVLFGCINELSEAIDNNDDHDSIRDILKKLLQYTRIHFRDEEMNLMFYDYSEYKTHKNEHEEFTKEVVEFALDFSAKPDMGPKMISFLQNWILRHILVSDKKYTHVLIDNDILEWE